jgi:hypothetical protein
MLKCVGGRLYLLEWELRVEDAQVVHQFPVFVSFLLRKILSIPTRLLLSIFDVYRAKINQPK